jgi:hypothetical protein
MTIDFLEENKIKYYIDRAKRKNCYIQIKNGTVIIKVTRLTTEAFIMKFLNEKKEWILSNVEKYEDNPRKNMHYKNLDYIYVLGKKYILRILRKENIKRSKVYLDTDINSLMVIIPNTISRYDEEDKVKALIDKYYKDIAKEEVTACMNDLIERTGLKPDKIVIKNLSATWGICSSKRVISINQNLMMYSRHSIEYVCLHELCHLRHMNHSKEFWDLVEKYLPDYKLAKKELKE